MKKCRRMIAFLLLLAMTFSLVACQSDSKKAEPTEPVNPGLELYTQARTALDSAADISLDLTVTTYTTVADSQFSEQSKQALTFRGIGTEESMILSEEEITYGIHVENSEEEAEPTLYTETWAGGNLYAQLDDLYKITSEMDAQTAADRYAPVVLLDAALYSTITTEELEGGSTRILFADPTAAEAWAMPEIGELTEASGSALVNETGALTEMNYSLTFAYGPTTVRMEVCSKPMDTVKEVSAPEDTSAYITTEVPDALNLYARATNQLPLADQSAIQTSDMIVSAAAAMVLTESSDIYTHGTGKDTIMKLESDIGITSYYENIEEEITYEIIYKDGKMTQTQNGGLPSTSSATWEDVSELLPSTMLADSISPDYWQSITATQFGSLYLMEYTFTEDFGNSTHNELCDELFGDPSLLYNMASEYTNDKLEGYLSIDLYTGLPVAMGVLYEGTHTIEGEKCLLSSQSDITIEAPALGAYKEITDEMPAEEEPETTPTPLFYKVTGENGQQMWLLGTIHIGDSRTAYLPEEIHNAFSESQALALECDTEAFDKQLEEDPELVAKVAEYYFYSGDVTLETLMEEEDYTLLVQLAKATGNYNSNLSYFQASVVSQMLEQTYIRLGYQLHSDMGVEKRLYAWAQEENKEILEVESNIFQLEMSANWSNDLQLMMLEDTMSEVPQTYWEGTMELYEMWCTGDEATLREEISNQVDTSTLTPEELEEYEACKDLLAEYNKTMEHDRNEGMLQKAIEYLESGKVVFYAVGLAHLIGDTNGLVDTLREAGYTVELVSYAE